jgi:hypothetical protein
MREGHQAQAANIATPLAWDASRRRRRAANKA